MRPGPIINGMPHTKRRLPRRMSVLLKKRVIPRAVKAAPEDKKIKPSLRLPEVRIVGSVGLDRADLRRCANEQIR